MSDMSTTSRGISSSIYKQSSAHLDIVSMSDMFKKTALHLQSEYEHIYIYIHMSNEDQETPLLAS